MVEAEISFPKTHDLVVILDLDLAVEPTWSELRSSLYALTSLGIEVRYPGMFADKEDADEALAVARNVRQLVRVALGQ